MPPKRATPDAAVAAPAKLANEGRKRRMDDEEEEEHKNEPVTKKMKPAAGEAVATKGAATTAITKQSRAQRKTRKMITKSTILKSDTSKRVSSSGTTAEKKKKDVQDKAASESTKTTNITNSTPTKSAAAAQTPVKASPSPTTTDSTSTAKRTTPNDKATVPKASPQPKKATNPTSKVKIGVKINSAPTQVLDVFVFGEGSAGELGLGNKRIDGKNVIDVKRPRLNPLLSAEDVGVVQIACGGMHALALTRDNRILTWGVNDNGALGRDTSGKGDEAESDDDSPSSSGLDPRESTPAEIDTSGVAPGTKFVQVVASDSASFALTEDGRVYSWGTFRNPDGILGFSRDVRVQPRPVLLDEPRRVVSLAAGSNHVLALDAGGRVQTWGAPEQCQLGRRVVQRGAAASALRPGGLAFRRGVRVVRVAAGAYHSFAVDAEGRAWAWGLNNYGQLGVASPAAPGDGGGGGDDDDDTGAVVLEPTLVDDPLLGGLRVTDVLGGEHHTLLVAEGDGADGAVLAFGRADGHQLGLPQDRYIPENSVFGRRGEPRVLRRPTRVDALPPAGGGAAGTDSNLIVTRDGRVYAWGFNENYQCGVGDTDADVVAPALLNNKAIRDRKIVYAGCGGQFGVLASVHE